MSDIWSAIGAVSAAVAAVVVVVAALYTRYQLKEARLARNVSLLMSFHETYHSIAMRTIREKLLNGEYGSPEEFDVAKLQVDTRVQLSQMFDQLQLLGLLVDRKLLDFGLVAAAFYSSPPRVWEALAPYARRHREANPNSKAFKHVESLAMRYRVQ